MIKKNTDLQFFNQNYSLDNGSILFKNDKYICLTVKPNRAAVQHSALRHQVPSLSSFG